MKKNYKKTILSILFTVFSLNSALHAQSLLKDLDTTTNSSSNPDQFITVNGSMYIHTKAHGYYNQIWKSDGTAAGTILFKDNIITSNQSTPVQMFNMNDTLYYFVNPNGLHGNIATLWKSDGTTMGTVLIDSLVTGDPFSDQSQAQPRNFTVVGNKLFFQMGKGSGLELWVTDGSMKGAHQVIDIYPGTLSGVKDQAMVAYNGKVYFSASPVDDDYELYASDGTAAGTTLVKDIDANNTVTRSSNPTNFIVYNNELYFYATSGVTGSSGGSADMWKTDGSTAGTILVAPGQFNAGQVVFKNELYFHRSTGLWKTNGTALGTTQVNNVTNTICGANSNYLISSYATSISTAPYIKMHYWRTDGTTADTVSTNVGYGASFTVLNNKMYYAGGVAYGVWSTDGTEAGSSQLSTNISQYCFAYNGNIYYNGWTSNAATGPAGYGYELWWINGGSTSAGIKQLSNEHNILIYPNPSNSIFYFENENQIKGLKVYSVTGNLIAEEKTNASKISIDLSQQSKGVYFYQLTDEKNNIKTGKLILE